MFEVKIEVAFDCECADDMNHEAECSMMVEWLNKGRKHGVKLNAESIGPNGHWMWSVTGTRLQSIYNMLLDYCSGDIDQTWDELNDLVIV